MEDGTTAVLAPDGTAPSRARYSNLFVKKEGHWLLASVREAAYVAPSNYENLRGLEWVIGEWVDENPGNEPARVSFAWAPDQNFIVSTRTVETKEGVLDRGTQWIGWDPVIKQIRSWNFESDGGFGEGVWTKDGDNWIIKTTSVLADGSGGSFSHSSSSSGGYGSYSHSGSTTATGRYGNTYSGSQSSSGSYYHGGYSTGGYGAYHYLWWKLWWRRVPCGGGQRTEWHRLRSGGLSSSSLVRVGERQPDYFATIAKRLAESGLLREENGRWRRVIIEKPFGHDLDSARQLNSQLTSVLQEHQIYRIDHYLGKETAQNLLVFRIGNAIFEPVWNRRYIDHVQLIVAESIGAEGRGAFYETAGAFRDVMQNHMFMLLALIAMEPPTSLEGEAIRNEKVKLLRSIHLSTPEEALTDTVRGQYGEGIVGGKKVSGYRQEPNVNPNSTVETYAAIKLRIDNWRWAGVPFYLRSGKRMPRRTTTIVVRFKTPPLSLFATHEADPISPNYLIFKIQPEEGIALQVRAKIPGPTISTRSVKLDFNYDQFGDRQPTTGYEKLLYDCMVGDASLFHRSDMVEAAWEAARRCIAFGREKEVDRRTGRVHGPVQVDPFAFDPDVLQSPPAKSRWSVGAAGAIGAEFPARNVGPTSRR